jgi:hypothetical protein
MAKKKRTSKALTKSAPKVPADWKEKLRQKALAESERVPVGAGTGITLKKNGQFFFQGASLGTSMKVVIVDHVVIKKYYDTPYDENNPAPPACFAIKPDGLNIAPHDNSPKKQNEVCEGCWANEWESGGRSRAKACADKRRLALLNEGDISMEADMVVMEVPVTSTAAFRKYVNKLNKAAQVPVSAVLTEISMDPEAEHQTLVFDFVKELPGTLGVVVEARSGQAREMLMTPYDTTGYTESKKGGSKKKAKKKAKKKVSSKKKRGKSRFA